MTTDVAKLPMSLFTLSVILLLGNLLAYTPAHADEAAVQTATATFPHLFQPSCNGVGGCKIDCLNSPGQCQGHNPPPDSPPPPCQACNCAAGSWSEWFTTTPESITITAAAPNEKYCRTVTTQNTCQFNLGDGGVTHISFDFQVSGDCSTAQGTEWLAFWMFRTAGWNPNDEVDFIESLFGPSTGLNTNFAGPYDPSHHHLDHQKVIFPGPAPWSGSIRSTFSGTGNAVSVSVGNSHNSEVATATLERNDGYFFVMDTAGGSQSSSCTITVSNLAVQGTLPPTLPNGHPNCVGLTGTNSNIGE